MIYPRLQNPVVEEPTFTHPNTHTSTHPQDTVGGEREWWWGGERVGGVGEVRVGGEGREWGSGQRVGERAESGGEGREQEEGRDRQKQNTTLVLYSCQLAVSGHKLVGNVEPRKIMSENLTRRCRYGEGVGGSQFFNHILGREFFFQKSNKNYWLL